MTADLDDLRCEGCRRLLAQLKLVRETLEEAVAHASGRSEAWRAQWAHERDRAERAENALERLRQLTEEGKP